MKLYIKNIKITNFLSVGAVPLEYTFQTGLHLIQGRVVNEQTKNGVGKSILLDAIVFAFFGKTLRKLKKDNIVNKINECDCSVLLWFEINGIPYRIERGLNPDYFRFINENEENEAKINNNEVEFKQRSNKGETQQKLNSKLGISFTSFVNIITQNINYSKPFFQLDAAEKRQILEDSFNMTLYGKMAKKVGKEWNEYKNNKRVLESELKNCIDNFNNKQETYLKIETLKKEFEESKQSELNELNKKLEIHNSKLEELKSKVPNKDFQSMKTQIQDVKDKIQNKIFQLNAEISSNNKQILKDKQKIMDIEKNPICPFCNSKTTNEDSLHHKNSLSEKIKSLEETNSSISNQTETLQIKLSDCKEKLNKLSEAIEKLNKLNNTISLISQQIKQISNQIDITNKKTINLKDVISKDDVEKSKLILEIKQKEYNDNEKMMLYSSHFRDILSEEGIKKFIIKKIVPVLNKKINEYLAMLNAYYTISFDSELNETFKTKRRKEYTYYNFSAGEQKKIDMAFMFALLSIVKAQNSIDCNILILDEICDSSICSKGIENLINFLKLDFQKLHPDLCTYVITHKSEIDEKNFNTIIKLKKENDFTRLEEIVEVSQSLI